MFFSIDAIQKPYEAPNMGQVNNLSVSPVRGFAFSSFAFCCNAIPRFEL